MRVGLLKDDFIRDTSLMHRKRNLPISTLVCTTLWKKGGVRNRGISEEKGHLGERRGVA